MKMIPVESSNIAAIGYDNETRALLVAFKNGSVYEHDGVPAGEHSALMSAESHGKYYNGHIKVRYASRPHRIDEAKRQRPTIPVVQTEDEQPTEPTHSDQHEEALRRWRGETS